MSTKKTNPPKKKSTKSTTTNGSSTTKKTLSKELSEDTFYDKIDKLFVEDNTPDVELVNKGQYKDAFDLLEDAEACQLTPMYRRRPE